MAAPLGPRGPALLALPRGLCPQRSTGVRPHAIRRPPPPAPPRPPRALPPAACAPQGEAADALLAAARAMYARLAELDPLRRGYYRDAAEGRAFVVVQALGTV